MVDRYYIINVIMVVFKVGVTDAWGSARAFSGNYKKEKKKENGKNPPWTCQEDK